MKLTQVSAPKPQTSHVAPAIEESVEAADPQENPGLYGIDPNTPEGRTAKKRLEMLRHTDPELYARIIGLN